MALPGRLVEARPPSGAGDAGGTGEIQDSARLVQKKAPDLADRLRRRVVEYEAKPRRPLTSFPESSVGGGGWLSRRVADPDRPSRNDRRTGGYPHPGTPTPGGSLGRGRSMGRRKAREHGGGRARSPISGPDPDGQREQTDRARAWGDGDTGASTRERVRAPVAGTARVSKALPARVPAWPCFWVRQSIKRKPLSFYLPRTQTPRNICRRRVKADPPQAKTRPSPRFPPSPSRRRANEIHAGYENAHDGFPPLKSNSSGEKKKLLCPLPSLCMCE